MNELLTYLPLLNLLVLPVFGAYLRHEIRLTRLEDHRERVELHLGFNDRRSEHHG